MQQHKHVSNIGIISDTHGLLRPEAVKALERSDLILHAGDVGSQQVLDALAQLAPLIAVRGNCDHGAWAEKLAAVESLVVGTVSLSMIHDLADWVPRAATESQVVISGHSHIPKVETREGVLYLNPGSAGRRRFQLPVTLARLTVAGDQLSAEIIYLLGQGGGSGRTRSSTKRSS